MKNKILFLITSNFPFGTQEAFLENEYPYLADAFEEVIIISNDLEGTKSRPIYKNTSIKRFPYFPSFIGKLFSIKYLFNDKVIEEVKYLRHYNISLWKRGILNTILVSYATGVRLSKYVESIIKEQNLGNEDITLYSYWCNDMATGLAILKTQMPSITAICRCHGYDLYFERSEIGYLPFRKFIYKSLNHVLFISQQGLDYAKEKFGAFNSFTLSYLGTPPHKNTISHSERPSFLIISCGRCVPVKRIDRLIDALSMLKNKQVLKWIHFGEGALLDELKNMAKDKLLDEPNITFEFYGNLENKELIKHYQILSPNLLVNTSESEGLPVTMMEAMSVGIPVISYDVGGISEIVKNGVNGYLIKETTVSALTQTLNNYMKLPKEELNILSENALNTWKTKFNASKNFPQLLKFLK